MDFLTHLCLPVAVAYALRPEYFRSHAHLSLGVFGLLPDVDKFIGIPGLLHSLVTLVPLCVGVLWVERRLRDRPHLGPLVVGLIASHLVLDVVDGGPVPLLFPFDDAGIGFRYPARAVFGEGPFGLVIDGPLVALATSTPRQGHNAYGFIDAFGVLSLLTLGVIYLGSRVES